MYDPQKGDNSDQLAGAFVVLILIGTLVMIISTVASHAKGAEPSQSFSRAYEQPGSMSYRRMREVRESAICSASRERVMQIVGQLTASYLKDQNPKTKRQLDKLREQITSGVEPRKIVAAYDRRNPGPASGRPELRRDSPAVLQRTR